MKLRIKNLFQPKHTFHLDFALQPYINGSIIFSSSVIISNHIQMKTKIQSSANNKILKLGNRLIIERKQNVFPPVKILNRNQNLLQSSIPKERPINNLNEFARTPTINNQKFSIIPYLINDVRRDQRTFQQQEKIRSKTEALQINKNPQHQLQQENLPPRPKSINKGIEQQKYQKVANKCKMHNPLQIYVQFNQKFMVQKQALFNANQQSKQNHILITEPGSKQREQNIKKQFQSIGVETDFSINSESYKQYMKFRFTQSQKFEKMKKLFEYIDEISQKDVEKFDSRLQQIKDRYNQAMKTQRQKGVVQICQSLIEKEQQIEMQFGNVLGDLMNLEKTNCDNVNTQIQMMKQQIRKVKQMTGQCGLAKDKQISIQPILQQIFGFKPQKHNHNNEPKTQRFDDRQEFIRLLQKRIDQFQNLCREIKRHSNQRHQQMQAAFKQSLKYVQKCMDQWKQAKLHKQFVIKACIQDILRLPEMSFAIFGMGSENANSEESQMMRKIGVVLDDVAVFGCVGKKPKNLDQIDQVFKEMACIKCLNCTYLKSKMKFIYSKNQQLEPVMKVLKYLIRWEAKRVL